MSRLPVLFSLQRHLRLGRSLSGFSTRNFPCYRLSCRFLSYSLDLYTWNPTLCPAPARWFANQTGKSGPLDAQTPTEQDKTEQDRSAEQVNRNILDTIQGNVAKDSSAGEKVQRENEAAKKTVEFALKKLRPKSSAREAVQGIPDPVRMQRMYEPYEGSSDAGGYIKLEDIGFSEREVDEKSAKLLSQDERIGEFDPKSASRRANELPYFDRLLKEDKKAQEGFLKAEQIAKEKQDKAAGKKTEKKVKEKDAKKVLEDGKETVVADDDEKEKKKDKAKKKEGNGQMEKKKKKGSKKEKSSKDDDSSSDSDSDDDEKPGKKPKSKDENERPKPSTQQTVLWENSRRSTSGAQASSDSGGVGQLTEQLLDRDAADRKEDKETLREGEEWKEGAREEGMKVQDVGSEEEEKKTEKSLPRR